MTEGKPFQPLGQYDWPALPTEDRLRLIVNRIKADIFRSSATEGPVVEAGLLENLASARLDRIAAPPAWASLPEDLSLTLRPWLDGTAGSPRTRLIVLPPCEGDNLLATWAADQGLTCLEPPARDELLGPSTPPRLDGEGVLAIPNLEHWFLRHRNGLGTVRLLLGAIAETERRCLVGCNSWAWGYLSSVIDADLLLPAGLTFQPFDRARLHDWFSELAFGPDTQVTKFRISDSGKDVFATDNEGEVQGDFFQKLAAHSLGIPWVAWTLWRRSLRETRETDPEGDTPEDAPAAEEEEENDANTVWIAAPEEFVLPVGHHPTALLVLQSLLIHGPLSVAHLRLTLPFVGQISIVDALERAGFVRRHGDLLSCTPAAYPAIRRALGNAGYSMDRL